MYVVFTPLLAALLLRVRPGGWTLVATALASVGVGAMSLRGWALGPGEALTLAAAGLYALHILGLGREATSRTAYPLTFVQLLTIGACLLAVGAQDGVQVPSQADLPTFLYLSVIAGAGAMLVQTWAQSHVPSAPAAVVMVLEPVWAAFFGIVLWREPLEARTVAGGALVVFATLLVVVMSRRPAALSADPAVVSSGPGVVSSGAADAAGVGALPPVAGHGPAAGNDRPQGTVHAQG
jgi:drug/metabolite transporter (DMT)-like permease